jgi:mono/diheme cytochrome c family protein
LRNVLDEKVDLPVAGLLEADPRTGRVAFRATCQVCHGLHGRGDGPAAEAIRPAPADLADPALAGVFTDALLYGTIRLGVPDTAMVAFEDQVDEPVLLAITAWVRTLPAGGP